MRGTRPQLVGLLATFLPPGLTLLAKKVDLGISQYCSALSTCHLALIVVNSAIIELLVGSVK